VVGLASTLVRSLLCAGLAATSGLGCASSPSRTADATEAPWPLLWRVDLPDHPGSMYLLGSVHLRDPDDAGLDAVVWDAFAQADLVVLEADVGNQLKLAALTFELGLLPSNERLSDHVSGPTYEALVDAASSTGLPLSMLSRMRPWLATIMVLAQQFEAEGLSPDAGIDRAIQAAAERDERPLLYLETAEQQLKLFAGLDETLQEAMLVDALASLSKPDGFQSVLDAYAAGDIDALADRVLRPLEAEPELAERLLHRRNRDWLEQLRSLSRRDQTLFVTVGAAHLLGDDGLLSGFERAGATVTRLRGRGPVQVPPPAERLDRGLATWTEVRDGRLGFRVEMPGEPRATSVEPLMQLELGRQWTSNFDVVAFSISAHAFRVSAGAALSQHARAIVDSSLQAAAAELGGDVDERREVRVEDGVASEAVIALEAGRAWVRAHAVGRRVFELRVVALAPHHEEDAVRRGKDRFFDSFSLRAADATLAAAETHQ